MNHELVQKASAVHRSSLFPLLKSAMLLSPLGVTHHTVGITCGCELHTCAAVVMCVCVCECVKVPELHVKVLQSVCDPTLADMQKCF